MSKHTTRSTLATTALAVLVLAACSAESPSAGEPPQSSAPAVSTPDGKAGSRDISKVKVGTYAGCFMRNEEGNIWYISPPAEVTVSMEDVDMGGALETGFETRVRAERSPAEIGEYASNPTCFVGFDQSGVQSQLDRYIGGSKEPGNRAVRIDYKG